MPEPPTPVLRFEFRWTNADLKRWNRLANLGASPLWINGSLLVVLVVMALADRSHWYISVGWLGLFALAWWWWARQRRKRAGAQCTVLLTSDYLESRIEEVVSQMTWQKVTALQENSRYWILRRGRMLAQLIPKRSVTAARRAEISHWIQQRIAAQPTAPTADVSQTGLALEMEREAPLGRSVRFRLQVGDYLKALKELGCVTRTQTSKPIPYFVLLVSVLLGILLAFSDFQMPFLGRWAWRILPVLAWAVFWGLFNRRLVALRLRTMDRLLEDEVKLLVAPPGLYVSSGSGISFVPWTFIKNVALGPTFLLFLREDMLIHFAPRQAIGDDQAVADFLEYACERRASAREDVSATPSLADTGNPYQPPTT